jgi:hypothetical protein
MVRVSLFMRVAWEASIDLLCTRPAGGDVPVQQGQGAAKRGEHDCEAGHHIQQAVRDGGRSGVS